VFGWTGTIAAAMAAIVVSFFLFGYWYPYWRRADMDFMTVYQGFLLNDGRPQDFFDHAGHLNVLLTEVWFRPLHGIGALKVIALSDIPPAADSVNFKLVWTAAVRAGRLLSLVLVLCFVGVFAALLRRLVADWRIAALYLRRSPGRHRRLLAVGEFFRPGGTSKHSENYFKISKTALRMLRVIFKKRFLGDWRP